jgi:hypothetical protein
MVLIRILITQKKYDVDVNFETRQGIWREFLDMCVVPQNSRSIGLNGTIMFWHLYVKGEDEMCGCPSNGRQTLRNTTQCKNSR